ncbi:hypothetical protein CVT26_014571 [Gymnopilus dilepis]|uniref:MARVEL domain-containing protein n=1 Tax=Gymnopilus dilepis TaxID=231916 RepID=A0A409W367_9AGAR|nr:hypothetical protein CVT26_014571 [Gymnopilus dilepis]
MSPSAPQPSSRNRQRPTSRARMSSLFNTIRACIYGTVILFTVICLAMAGHFQSVLAASDLTRFVPFAIFVCSASLFIFLILFFLRGRNPISTRIELASLGLAGVFWLVHTDQYQAMYRVLNTFSLMNAILVIFACLALLFLAVRRHRKGDEHMWHGPVTSCAWFNSYDSTKQNRGKTSSASILPVATAYMGEPVYTEKPERKASSRRDRDRTYASTRPYEPRNPYPTPPKEASARPTRHGSGSSPRSGSSTRNLENGGMLNPYSNRSRAPPRAPR